MLWIIRFSGFFYAAMLMIVLSPSFQSFPPAEAIRSSHHNHLDYSYLHLPPPVLVSDSGSLVGSGGRFNFRKAYAFRNSNECASPSPKTQIGGVCDPNLVHVAFTLDVEYLCGSIAAVHSVLQHSLCPESVFFHFLVSETNLEALVQSTFLQLKFRVYYFDPRMVQSLILTSVRQALEQPLRKIAEAFKELEAAVNSQTAEIEVAPFSSACSLVSPLFGCLGIAFKFAEIDYVAKVYDLVEVSNSISTLQVLLDRDIEGECVRKAGSHSRNLLGVKRGLDMVRVLFEQIILTKSKSDLL